MCDYETKEEKISKSEQFYLFISELDFFYGSGIFIVQYEIFTTLKIFSRLGFKSFMLEKYSVPKSLIRIVVVVKKTHKNFITKETLNNQIS
jgi:hypothetical protein